MEGILGLIKIRIKRGTNLIARDTRTSDPYVVITLGEQALIYASSNFGRGVEHISPITGPNNLEHIPHGLVEEPNVVKLKTVVVKDNCNPEWNEELTLYVRDVNIPIHLAVFDKDTFTVDDKIGDADIDIKPYLQCVKMELNELPDGHVVKKVQPNRTNCLAEESSCIWKNGKLIQEMSLRLRNVKSGEVIVEIEWVNLPDSKGLSEVEF